MADIKKDICIITQARMTSTRLPGKIMLEAGGKSMLEHHIERLEKTGASIILATTTNVEDDPVVSLAKRMNLTFFRGSETDVLSRFAGAAAQTDASIFVRVTSDCPLIDPELIMRGLEVYQQSGKDNVYVSNCFPRTYARGFDFEIFSRKMLLDADMTSQDSFQREHVTPAFWKNEEGKFILKNISQEKNHGHLRITVDTPEDYSLIQKLIEEYHADALGYEAIEEILITHPDLIAINAHVEQKKN